MRDLGPCPPKVSADAAVSGRVTKPRLSHRISVHGAPHVVFKASPELDPFVQSHQLIVQEGQNPVQPGGSPQLPGYLIPFDPATFVLDQWKHPWQMLSLSRVWLGSKNFTSLRAIPPPPFFFLTAVYGLGEVPELSQIKPLGTELFRQFL